MTEPFPLQDKTMAMNALLAEFFGNDVEKTASASQPELSEEQAQVAIFQKLASDNNVDLDKLSEEQITHLWNGVFGKTAEAEEPKKDDETKEKESAGDDEAKKEEAKKELEEKKEAAAKVAEATFLGQVMAHSLTAELRKIAAAHEQGGDPGETPSGEEPESKEAAMPPQLAAALKKGKALAGKAGKAVGDAASKAHGVASSTADKGGKKLEHFGKKITEKATGVGTSNMKPSHAKGVGAATIGAGAAIGAGAGAAAAKAGKKKESSAIDALALEEALKLAEAAGLDLQEVADRVTAVQTLDLVGESQKVASANNIDDAIGIRALEFLEAAGYDVTWNDG